MARVAPVPVSLVRRGQPDEVLAFIRLQLHQVFQDGDGVIVSRARQRIAKPMGELMGAAPAMAL